ncbi:serine hydrolase domain-containing protein [Peristeroidobacter soli]|uniref:serine hydrolase domain-containing protein n=1 Tax=Peristeroidobacter soli TaxID=2497877 RepID=UPI00158E662E|nr:serine hydrolase [Peristeroidobacter soli]
MAIQPEPHTVEALPRSTPEAQGVNAAAILRFLSAVRGRYELHSFLFVRRGHVIAEGWSAPYRRDAVQLLNSISKSFTATAVGFAVAEGRFAVGDRVLDFFPRQAPEHVSAHLQALTVEHLLTMSVGQTGNPSELVVRERDWVKAFFAVPIEHAPGSTFAYNNVATYMLSAIVQKVCGQRLIDYLEPRLFGPLGIRRKHWESCPAGINVGGWGLSLTSESIAKFGQLHLQRGTWQGRQLLPRSWIERASSAVQSSSAWNVVAQEGESLEQALARLKVSSDWHQGYGYQLWRCRHDAYRADGAYGQFCVVLPDQEAVIVMTSHTVNMQGLLDEVWEHLLPALHDRALPRDPASVPLQHALASMAVPAPVSQGRGSSLAQASFTLDSNTLGALRASLRVSDDVCVFKLEFTKHTAEVQCGFGRWIDNVLDMPGTPPKFIAQGERRPLGVAAAAFWEGAQTLKMQWRYYETPNHDVVTCRFDADAVTIEFMSDTIALSKGLWSEARPTLQGRRMSASAEAS